MQKATLNQLSSLSIRSRFTWLLIKKNRDILVQFDEILLFLISLMRSRLIDAHESFSSSLMSRFVRFDESLAVWWDATIWVVSESSSGAHTSLDKSRTSIRHSICREWACVTRWIEARQSETLTMKWSSKITRTNRHKKSLHEKIWIVFLKSHFTSRQNAKHVINIFSQQIVSLIFIAIMNISQRNSLNRACKKKKIVASEKVYNCHVLEKKQFTNKTFTFIYYRLLSQKYEHDLIISWS